LWAASDREAIEAEIDRLRSLGLDELPLFNDILGILRSVCDGDPSAAKSVGSIASQ
jgi:hypothetical protein